MRAILAIFLTLSVLSLKAQSYVPFSRWDYTQLTPFPAYHQFANVNPTDHKWQLSKFGAVSAGYVFYGGGGTSFLTAPMGLQLTRPLNNNVFAFTAVSIAPTVFSVNRLLAAPVNNQFYPNNGYGLGVNGRIEAGLMYVNDARTFSISGSVSVDRGSYPVYPSNRPETFRKQ